MPNQVHNWSFRRIWVWVLLGAPLLMGMGKPAAETEKPECYVDPSPFVELAGESPDTVAVYLEGPLLKAVAKRASKDSPELSDLLGRLELINSVVTQLSEPSRVEDARTLIRTQSEKLRKQDWQQLALLRDAHLETVVFVHLTADHDMDGLVVMSIQKDRLIFSNIAGGVDLEKLARLQSTLSIPGLDEVPSEYEEFEEKSTLNENFSATDVEPDAGSADEEGQP